MNAGPIHTQAVSIAAVLRMDHDVLSPYYAFPLFVADHELLNRKIPAINFLHNGELVTDPVKLNQSGKEMVRMAFSSLRQKEALWQPHEVNGQLQYLVATGSHGESIAEKILDPVFMQDACNILKSKEL